MVSGVYAFISFVCIYYLLLSVLDAVGSIRKYKMEVSASENPAVIKIKFDSNLDLAVISIIYLVSYYSGLFQG